MWHAWEGREMHTRFFLEGDLKASFCIEDIDIGVSIILKCFVRRYSGIV
jgi:hypothetical protein